MATVSFGMVPDFTYPSYDIPNRLASSTLAFVGRSLYCRPIYGWGWSFFDGFDRKEEPVPSPFYFHLVELFEWNGVLRGGFGIVAEMGHRYHGRWVTFYTRGGTNDFLNNAFSCNVSFFTSKPALRSPAEDPEFAKFWPLLDISRRMDKRPEDQLAFGQGDVAADEDVLLLRDTMGKMRRLPAGSLPY